MLNSLRTGKGSTFMYVLMGLLALSLVGFGVGGSGFGRPASVAEVGDVSITARDYGRAATSRLYQLSNEAGERMGREQAQALGVFDAVLQEELGKAALLQEAQTLGLSTSDETVAKTLLGLQAFRGPDGKFDANAYARTLKSQGFTEKEFEKDIRENTTRSLVMTALSSGYKANPILAQNTYSYLNETRTLSYITLEKNVEAVETPANEALQAYYKDHPESYTKPETRVLTYISLTPETLAESIEVSEDELKALYEKRLTPGSTPSYATEEARIIDQIAFPSLEEAQAAKALIDAQEKSFDQIVDERGLTVEDIDRGALTKSQMGGEAAEALFSTDELGVYGPFEMTLGPTILRVNGVIKASSKSFDEVKSELQRELALKDAINAAIDEGAKIDEMLASGATLEEVAKETRAELKTLDYNSESTEAIAGDPAFVEAALKVTKDDYPIWADLTNSGGFALRLEDIKAPELLSFEAVSAKVEADYKDAEAAKNLADKALEIETALENKATLEDIARDNGVSVETAENIKRIGDNSGIPLPLRTVLKTQKEGEFVKASQPGTIWIGRVDAVQSADPESADAQDQLQFYQSTFDKLIADDATEYTLDQLAQNAGIKVNRQVIDAIINQIN